ncbi:hypothetical protein [Dactylosporangium matsuzakiense]|uniref:hypothetical protein n=1 Tax=Dactylosporangium matsuzakiense TaxID=53360 RepID=UPI0021C33A73|nr:hypothetical protein [Dactylosporangium matsuzakiense]UWZ41835.1 hypothetical protein Dmats_29920 [Dactylosporangium matsuzakiense]
MTSTSFVRAGALVAPALLFGYGTLRLVDRSDGHMDKGAWMWNTGHVMFFIAMALLAALAVGARARLPLRAFGNRLAANLAVVATLVGGLAFLWVITGDLFPSFRDTAPLPTALAVAGNAAFMLGLLTLLIQLVRAARLPAWSPAAVLFAFLMIAVSLDTIPVAAVLLFVGLLPLSSDRAPLSGSGPRLARG